MQKKHRHKWIPYSLYTIPVFHKGRQLMMCTKCYELKVIKPKKKDNDTTQ